MVLDILTHFDERIVLNTQYVLCLTNILQSLIYIFFSFLCGDCYISC